MNLYSKYNFDNNVEIFGYIFDYGMVIWLIFYVVINILKVFIFLINFKIDLYNYNFQRGLFIFLLKKKLENGLEWLYFLV